MSMGLRELFSFNDTDHLGTIEGLVAGIEFRGTNIWLLILAMLIASLGLNVNSTAVIIGAMLISPLMGPIAGAGMALGIYDWSLLKRSLMNLGIMTALSLGASTLYFTLSPLTAITAELQARTAPTFFDVLIALTGGLALIISVSRKVKSGNPIAGVAIATALMPPLCTAGFGLATRNWPFFFGALYLYLINSVFIGLAVFLFTKYLKLKEVTPQAEITSKKLKWQHVGLTLLFGILFVIPSLFIGYDMIQESSFQTNVSRFITRTMQFPTTKILDVQKNRKANPPEIIVTLGGTPISQEVITHLSTLLPEFTLDGVKLSIIQSTGLVSTQSLPVHVTEETPLINPSPAPIIEPKDVAGETIPDEGETIRKSLLENIEQEVLVAFPTLDRILWGDLMVNPQKPFSNSSEFKVYANWRPRVIPGDKMRLATFLKLRLGIEKLTIEDMPE
ncbi:MAG: hypothetical protein A2Z96_04375 [Spirochaetes bacterium GWB1_48_6]|nr:MAG: hypothetical protein A2Z96_04375 [Spirochaetes bacterium GWB1_48_6]